MKNLYNDGFIPGPKESEEEFFKRISIVKKIIDNPKQYIPIKGPISPLNKATLLLRTKNLFFHGSSTLIIEVEGVTLSIIKEPSRLSRLFVTKEEVFNHELIHARRALFDKSKFEEIIAYKTSPSKFRQLISPLFNSTFETLLFLTLSFFIPFYSLPFLAYFSFLLFRLHKRTKIVNKCIYNLKKHPIYNEKYIEGMLDSEIILASLGKLNKLKSSCFRWKFLKEAFQLDL